ncbi:MAG: hypothetical protein AAGM84_12415 [Pseudomonadota bacterium]
MIITKYFNAESNWEHYSSGSFKVGTLSEYRGYEHTQLARMTDRGEGTVSKQFGSGVGHVPYATVGPVTLTNFNFSAPGGIVVENSFNEHVFCASVGTYKKEHHELMRFGGVDREGQAYVGNEDLDAFAEIDFDRFLMALRAWCRQSGRMTTRTIASQYVFSKPVTYGENRNTYYDLEKIALANAPFGDEELKRAIFSKPIEFLAEAEIRVVVSTKFPDLPDRDAAPLFPSSAKLRDSILHLGTLEG